MRLFPPVLVIPKWTIAPQPIQYNKKTHIIAPRTLIHLNTVGVHRNPKYWVLPGQTVEEAAVDEWRPERWFKRPHDTGKVEDFAEDDAPRGKDTSGAFFKPYPGSFIPFSVGSRACLGRNFAQVELVASLTVLFRNHSIELDVRQGETHADAKRRAWAYVEHSSSILTLKPRGAEVGIRCVPRGKERYFPPQV